jgi:hypothetical protein
MCYCATGVSFDVNPINGGQIICNGFTVPTNQLFYVDSNTQCVAKSNKGFQFYSWVQNLGSNSSRTIKVSEVSKSLLDQIWTVLGIGQTLSDSRWKEVWTVLDNGPNTSANLNVTQFGNFVDNF